MLNVNETLGKRIKKHRELLGLSQSDFGKEFQLKKQIISYYEHGKREPGIDLIVAFAKKFNVSVDYLLGKSNYPNPSIDEYILEKCKTDNDQANTKISNLVNEVTHIFSQYSNAVKLPPEHENQKPDCYGEASIFEKMVAVYLKLNNFFESTINFASSINNSEEDYKNIQIEREKQISDISLQLRLLSMHAEGSYTSIKFQNEYKPSIVPNNYTLTENSRKLLAIQTLITKPTTNKLEYEPK